MDKKVNLIGTLFIAYILILALCFLFYSLVVLPVNGVDKVNAIIGLLSWSATIYAPIAAFLLIDNWKVQKKYELKKEYVGNAFQDLRPIFTKILTIHSFNSNIVRIDESLVINQEYLDYKQLEVGNLVTYLYGNIKVISTLDKNNKLIQLYDELEMHAFFIDLVYKNLIKRYKNYYDAFTNDLKSNQDYQTDIFRPYLNNEKDRVQNHIIFLKIYEQTTHEYTKVLGHNNSKILKYGLTELLDKTLDLHDEIQDNLLDIFVP